MKQGEKTFLTLVNFRTLTDSLDSLTRVYHRNNKGKSC